MWQQGWLFCALDTLLVALRFTRISWLIEVAINQRDLLKGDNLIAVYVHANQLNRFLYAFFSLLRNSSSGCAVLIKNETRVESKVNFIRLTPSLPLLLGSDLKLGMPTRIAQKVDNPADNPAKTDRL